MMTEDLAGEHEAAERIIRWWKLPSHGATVSVSKWPASNVSPWEISSHLYSGDLPAICETRL